MILEGSVRRADNRVRIVAQLIEAATEEHLWAENYDRDLDDIFQVQSDVAQQIASALKDEAHRWLEEAIEAGWRDYDLLLRDPTWADFQGEDRFRQMVAAVQAELAEMRRQVEEMEKEWA